jgi:8-oxo-dGTP diphosphatase
MPRSSAGSALRPTVALTVDPVVLGVDEDLLQVLVVRRNAAPFAGRWAFPGGFVEATEDLPAAVRRELGEETGLGARIVRHLEQLGAYGAPRRDPRGRVVTVAFLVLVAGTPQPRAGDDAGEARWWPVEQLLARPRTIAFDHATILRDGVARLQERIAMAPLATALVPREFTVGELRRVYEAVWDAPVDPRNFHRKVTRTPGLLEPTDRTTTRHGGRPARLYRRGRATHIQPPMTLPFSAS